MQAVVDLLNGVIWSPALVYLALIAGLIYSILTRFVQVRFVGEMWRLLFSGNSSSAGISSFQALSVSLSGRVGTGNIAGVAAAIGFGGPGAVFWMWVVAFLGAATAFVEAALGQIYKEELDGEYRGGPAFYFEKAMGQKWYAWVFAIATILATGLLLPGVQSNAISLAAETAFGPGQMVNTAFGELGSTRIITAVVVVLVLGFIIFGGVQRIAKFTQVVVPFMALAYILVAMAIILLNISELPRVIGMIAADAFSPMAGVGAAIGWGVKRGIYSNEAGQGTGGHAAAAAEVEHPAQQGLVQAFSVYIDTLFVCSATAFMILITGAYNVHNPDGGFLVQNLGDQVAANSPYFTQTAVESVIPGVGEPFVAFALFFFSFTTVLAYYYIAETNIAYIRRTVKIPGMVMALKIVIMTAVFYGAVRSANLAWGMGDIGVGIMAWLNIVGMLIILVFCSRPALRALADYEEQFKRKVSEYTFDPDKLGISNAHFWSKK